MPVVNVVGAVAGTKLFIAPPGAIVASPNPWVEIKEVSSFGDIGTTFAKIAVESVGSGFTKQIKGTQSAPSFEITLNRLDSDPGQTALRVAAEDRNALYNFKVEENDAGTGDPTTTTFKGRVYGAPFSYGGVNALKTIKTSIEIEPDSIATVEAE